jgi:hypothetical protein
MTMSAVDEPAELAMTGRDQSDQSIAVLIKQVSEESSRLLRGELRLAQAEMTEKAKTAGPALAHSAPLRCLAGSLWAAS